MSYVSVIVLILAVVGLLVLAGLLADLLGLGPKIAAMTQTTARMIAQASAAAKSVKAEALAAREQARTTTPVADPTPSPKPSTAPPGSPTFSLRGQIAELEAANRTVSVRNRYLFGFLILGILLVVLVVWGVYNNEVLSYAVIDHLKITRDPVNEGRFLISFEVTSPGKIVYRRTSGTIETEVVDQFRTTGPFERSWSWIYEPGKETNVSLRYRAGLWKAERAESFPTSDSVDIVILMDTTGSMSRSIAQLKEKCVSFSSQLGKQNLKHRFALIGFGDRSEGSWLDKHAFTTEVDRFRGDVEIIQRFDGGDFPESALDALEEALALPFKPGAVRRFYLVTDARYHEPTMSGKNAAAIAKRLEQEKVLLNVFSSGEFQPVYQPLLGVSGKFLELSSFGEVLAQGRVLED